MFHADLKRMLSNQIQALLRSTEHPELPEGEISFLLHVDGLDDWSWANIRNNGYSIKDGCVPADLLCNTSTRRE